MKWCIVHRVPYLCCFFAFVSLLIQARFYGGSLLELSALFSAKTQLFGTCLLLSLLFVDRYLPGGFLIRFYR